MKNLSCPICGAEPQHRPADFSLVRCKKCALTWTFTDALIDEENLYSDEMYRVVDNRRSFFERIINYEARSVLKKSDQLLRCSSRKLLDFGSGKGHFLRQAALLGWKAQGVETSPERAKFARTFYKVDVRESVYKEGMIGEHKYDLITLNHVLEHLSHPMELLCELLEANLAESGIAMVEVPRLDSWQAKIAGNDWMHLDIPRHLSHWTESRLTEALEKIGYKVIARRRFSIHLGVLGMLQALCVLTGYRDNIIVGLKHKRSKGLMSRTLLLTPIALFLESLATVFNKTGVMGLYIKKA